MLSIVFWTMLFGTQNAVDNTGVNSGKVVKKDNEETFYFDFQHSNHVEFDGRSLGAGDP